MTTSDKIKGFGDLPQGWHYGSGVPANPLTVDLALKIETLLRQSRYPETDAFPGCEGEILVTGYLDGCSVSIEVRDEGRYKPINAVTADDVLDQRPNREKAVT